MGSLIRPWELQLTSKIRKKMREKAILKTYSEHDTKKLPKGSQKGCQEAFKIEISAAKMATRSDLSSKR